MGIVRTEERRRFRRLNGRIFVLCQLMEKEVGRIIKTFTRDISGGGLCFETEQLILAGTMLGLEIYQPLSESREKYISISALGKVKWVTGINITKRDVGSNKYRVGVEFVKVGGKERKEIIGYVKDELSGQG